MKFLIFMIALGLHPSAQAFIYDDVRISDRKPKNFEIGYDQSGLWDKGDDLILVGELTASHLFAKEQIENTNTGSQWEIGASYFQAFSRILLNEQVPRTSLANFNFSVKYHIQQITSLENPSYGLIVDLQNSKIDNLNLTTMGMGLFSNFNLPYDLFYAVVDAVYYPADLNSDYTLKQTLRAQARLKCIITNQMVFEMGLGYKKIGFSKKVDGTSYDFNATYASVGLVWQFGL